MSDIWLLTPDFFGDGDEIMARLHTSSRALYMSGRGELEFGDGATDSGESAQKFGKLIERKHIGSVALCF